MNTFSNSIVFKGTTLGFHRINSQVAIDIIAGKIRFALLSWENSNDAASGKYPKKATTVEITNIEIGNVVTQIQDYVVSNISTIINPIS